MPVMTGTIGFFAVECHCYYTSGFLASHPYIVFLLSVILVLFHELDRI